MKGAVKCSRMEDSKMALGIPLWILIPLAIATGAIYFKLDKMVKEKNEREMNEGG